MIIFLSCLLLLDKENLSLFTKNFYVTYQMNLSTEKESRWIISSWFTRDFCSLVSSWPTPSLCNESAKKYRKLSHYTLLPTKCSQCFFFFTRYYCKSFCQTFFLCFRHVLAPSRKCKSDKHTSIILSSERREVKVSRTVRRREA